MPVNKPLVFVPPLFIIAHQLQQLISYRQLLPSLYRSRWTSTGLWWFQNNLNDGQWMASQVMQWFAPPDATNCCWENWNNTRLHICADVGPALQFDPIWCDWYNTSIWFSLIIACILGPNQCYSRCSTRSYFSKVVFFTHRVSIAMSQNTSN